MTAPIVAPARRVDWAWGPGHGPVTGAVNAGSGALAATMVASLAGVPAWYPAVAGAAAALAAAVVAGIRSDPGPAVAYRVVCWLAAGTWSALTLALSDPWAVRALAALAGGIAVVAVVGVGLARDRERAVAVATARREAATGQRAARSRDALGGEWEARIERVCSVTGAQVVGCETWKGGGGYTLDVTLPPGGATWEHLRTRETGLASDMRLPEGCGVEVRPGADRGSALVFVSTRDVLAESLPYPREYGHETVNNPRCFGIYSDGSPVLGDTRQGCALFIGQAGSGKTNLMNVAIAEHAKCVDVILCVIDFNGGGLAIPWLAAWRENPEECLRPPIDWVADTPDEALRMTEFLIRVAKSRKSDYAERKRERNETLLPIDSEVPEFVLFVDEVAEVLGVDARDPTTRRVGGNVSELIRIGRDSGVRTVISGLAATMDTVGNRMNKVQSRIRSALRGQDVAEMLYLFETNRIDVERASHPGTGFWQEGRGTPRPYRVPLLTPSQITEITMATSDRRPDIDAYARRQDTDGAWSGRWERAGVLLSRLRGGRDAGGGGGEDGGVTGTDGDVTPERRTAKGGLDSALAGMRDAREAMMRAAADAERARTEGGGDDGADDVVVTDDDWKILESWLGEGERPRAMMRRVIRDAGAAGIGSTAILEALRAAGHTTTPQTLHKWLRGDVARGILAQPGGPRTPYTIGPSYGDA